MIFIGGIGFYDKYHLTINQIYRNYFTDFSQASTWKENNLLHINICPGEKIVSRIIYQSVNVSDLLIFY